ncbi:sorting nexin-1a isoform X2 [Embiotoca jacksoni]|uniref:sorting nexin-1a isoform X2 n=1 Tax=Embiotoca jacksoni TaxID=100190 RepID=UPI00370483A2
MATSSERSPPPFPDSEDQDVLDSEEVGGRDSDEDDGEDLFVSAISPPLIKMDSPTAPASEPSDVLSQPPSDIVNDPLFEPVSRRAGNTPASDVISEPLDEFFDLTNNITVTAERAVSHEIPLDEPSDDFVDILGSETEAQREEAAEADVTAGAATDKGEMTSGETDPPGDWETGSDAKQEAKEASPAPVIDPSGDFNMQQPPASDNIVDPLVDLLGDAPPPPLPAADAAGAKKLSGATMDLFEDEGIDLFSEPRQTKSAKQQRSLFGEPDEDLFGEPLGAVAKKTINPEQKEKSVPSKAAAGGPLQEPADIFTEEAVTTVPSVSSASTVTSRTNGVHSEEETDIFAEATVELSLDSPRNERKKEATAKPSASASASASLSAAASLVKPQPAALEELEEEEEEELEDKFEIFVSVKDPEKIGDGMTAYMAYKVSTQSTLPMFRSKTFTVRRRFSDFLGLYEKLSEKHGPNGFIVPPPPEKSIMGNPTGLPFALVFCRSACGPHSAATVNVVSRRDDKGEGGEGGFLVCGLRGEETRRSGEVSPAGGDSPVAAPRSRCPRVPGERGLAQSGEHSGPERRRLPQNDQQGDGRRQQDDHQDERVRRELSLNTASFAKSTAMLGSAEDNTALSRALSQLAEVEDKMEQLHQDQAANDTFSFAELIADYIRLLGAVRGSFDQRMKAWQRWQDAQATLQKKRETEAKLLWANKPDKLQLAKEEIAEWEAKVTQYERDFERVSATVRKEVVRFEKEKTKNFKRQIVKYLESLLQSQQQLIKYWEAFLPEAKAIA